MALRREIDKLYRDSGEHHMLRQTNAQLEFSLKELRRKSMQMTESLGHLWSIKEAEYHNVNHLLGLAKHAKGN